MATFTIDLLTGNLYLFNGDFNGSGSTPTSGSTYPQVANFTELPPPASASGKIYVVRNGYGAYVLNRKPSGLYFSSGVEWRFLGETPDFFKSNNFQIIDGGDTSKGVMFTTSGISTNVFRKLKIQNSDGTIAYLTDLNTKVNTSVFAQYTGTTAPATFLSKTAFGTYSGTTVPANYYNKAQINTYSGATLLLIGNKQDKLTAGPGISIVGNTISATGNTTGSWNGLSDKPQWLSGDTLQKFQTGHTHSYDNLTNKLTPGVGITIINNVISATGGGGTGTTALQLLDTNGNSNINTITGTPITWSSMVFSGTSLSFTGGSRIYVQANGVYEISYVVNVLNNTGSVKNIGTVIRKNGTADITPFSSSSFSFDLANNVSTNILPAYLMQLTAGNYIELIGFRIGTTGSAYTKASGSWINIKRIN